MPCATRHSTPQAEVNREAAERTAAPAVALSPPPQRRKWRRRAVTEIRLTTCSARECCALALQAGAGACRPGRVSILRRAARLAGVPASIAQRKHRRWQWLVPCGAALKVAWRWSSGSSSWLRPSGAWLWATPSLRSTGSWGEPMEEEDGLVYEQRPEVTYRGAGICCAAVAVDRSQTSTSRSLTPCGRSSACRMPSPATGNQGTAEVAAGRVGGRRLVRLGNFIAVSSVLRSSVLSR
jgi:hypothetical protein